MQMSPVSYKFNNPDSSGYHGQLDQRDFVSAMAAAATQVTVVTTDGPGGKFGVTVSAFSSVSAEPPMVLVCVKQNNPVIAAIEQNQFFCVNLLNKDQDHIANCFAGRSGAFAPYDFACSSWQVGRAGVPILDNATASFECHVDNITQAGTHHIILGNVISANAADCKPLVYSNRQYQALHTLPPKTLKNKGN